MVEQPPPAAMMAFPAAEQIARIAGEPAAAAVIANLFLDVASPMRPAVAVVMVTHSVFLP
jgi:hypothetical protein